MSKKSRRKKQKLDVTLFEDGYDDLYDDFDLDDLSKDIYSTEWGDENYSDDQYTARRKIERRRDMKKLYSELDDWEEFGSRAEW